MKKLVLCCDGTWNRVDQETDGELCPTNVIKLAVRVAKRHSSGAPQIVYYDEGVGTGNTLDKYTGGALGDGLADNIFEAYRFLVGNYEPGDEIYLFGFSRGAFTVRSLAGMIRKCGILDRPKSREYPAAVETYRSPFRPDDPACREFRSRNALGGDVPVRIRMIGVFDTVGALGIPVRGLRSLSAGKYVFHDTELSGSVDRAYHALAIDERRAPFLPSLWDYKPKDQVVEQMWFCGVHTDIGGGYPQPGLSDVTLRWMMDKAADSGLELDGSVTAELPLHPDPLIDLHNSKKGLYRLTKGIDREIGLAGETSKSIPPGSVDATQRVHETVLERWDKRPDYRPPGLREYFRRIGDRRGA